MLCPDLVLLPKYSPNSIALGRFELPSTGPEPVMLGHYTTGLNGEEHTSLSLNTFAGEDTGYGKRGSNIP